MASTDGLSCERFSIALEDVRFHAYIGVLEQERIVGNEYALWIEADIAVSSGMASDKLDLTISYADIYEEVRIEMSEPCALLETKAWLIGKRLRLRWPEIERLKVKICKTAPPIPGFMGSASIEYLSNR